MKKPIPKGQFTKPTPAICRFVIYRISAKDAAEINRRRTSGDSIRQRMNLEDQNVKVHWPAGAQAHIGNEVVEGREFPMLMVAIAPEGVNGQVFLDGNDNLWVQSAKEGMENGQWHWPQRG